MQIGAISSSTSCAIANAVNKLTVGCCSSTNVIVFPFCPFTNKFHADMIGEVRALAIEQLRKQVPAQAVKPMRAVHFYAQ